MMALTLHPEHAGAICYLGKDVENRTWKPPEWVIGERIAIHAGKEFRGRRGMPAIQEVEEALRGLAPDKDISLWSRPGQRRGVRMEFLGPSGLLTHVTLATSAIVATAKIAGVVNDSPSRWAMPDCWHWLLEDLHVFERPVPVPRGFLQLWPVADALLPEVR